MLLHSTTTQSIGILFHHFPDSKDWLLILDVQHWRHSHLSRVLREVTIT